MAAAVLLVPAVLFALLLVLSIFFLPVGVVLLAVAGCPVVVFLTRMRHEPALVGLAVGCMAVVLVVSAVGVLVVVPSSEEAETLTASVSISFWVWWVAVLVAGAAVTSTHHRLQRPTQTGPG